IVYEQSFVERSAVVCADAADREQFVAATREQRRFAVHMSEQHCPVRDRRENDSFGEIRPELWLCAHLNSPRRVTRTVRARLSRRSFTRRFVMDTRRAGGSTNFRPSYVSSAPRKIHANRIITNAMRTLPKVERTMTTSGSDPPLPADRESRQCATAVCRAER